VQARKENAAEDTASVCGYTCRRRASSRVRLETYIVSGPTTASFYGSLREQSSGPCSSSPFSSTWVHFSLKFLRRGTFTDGNVHRNYHYSNLDLEDNRSTYRGKGTNAYPCHHAQLVKCSHVRGLVSRRRVQIPHDRACHRVVPFTPQSELPRV